MLLVVLCNFLMQFGKLFFEKFAKFFSILARILVITVVIATTAALKFPGEVAL